jgi:hypothetical protein
VPFAWLKAASDINLLIICSVISRSVSGVSFDAAKSTAELPVSEVQYKIICPKRTCEKGM